MNSAISIGITLLLGVVYSWTSRLNGLFFFGRTADAEVRASEEGRAITRQYLTGVVLATIAAAGMAWATGYLGYSRLGPAAILLEVVSFFALFARANGQVRRLVQGQVSVDAARASVVQVELLAQPAYWIPGIAAILLPLAVCAGALAIAVLVVANGGGLSAGWIGLSNSMDGQGDSGLLGLATGLLVAASGLLVVFRSSARLRTRMAQYTVRACISMEWIGTALLVGVLACNRLGIAISRGMGKGLMLAAMITSILVLVWNQARYKRFVPAPVELGADDRWRWGLFYVDRGDPALFVQSRCGSGYTLNYGRVAAWPISLGVVAYLLGVMFFLPHHR
ncbi:MAG TPA: hypothetical protein VF865_19835 [Acidobacteriaceae bacterium]